MVIMEDRELRDAAKKCVEGEMRVVLIEELLKKGLGFKEIEDFVSRERKKLRAGDEIKGKMSYSKHRDIVKKLMLEKLRDGKRDCIRLRREKCAWLKKLKERLK